MPKITDEQYRYLSRAVYFVGKFPHQYRKGRMVTIHGRKYVVEDVESNEENGLQALAVTPKNDPDELVIAYGGTDPADINDALTDIEFIALGREHRPLEDGRDRLREVIAENPRVQELISRLGLDGTALLAARGSGDSQAVSALKFAHRVAGGRTFTTTGHSLGASLAIYVAVKLRMSSTCFNGTGHQRHPVRRRMRLHQKPPLRVQKLPHPRRHHRQRHSRPSRLRNHRRGTARIP